MTYFAHSIYGVFYNPKECQYLSWTCVWYWGWEGEGGDGVRNGKFYLGNTACVTLHRVGMNVPDKICTTTKLTQIVSDIQDLSFKCEVCLSWADIMFWLFVVVLNKICRVLVFRVFKYFWGEGLSIYCNLLRAEESGKITINTISVNSFALFSKSFHKLKMPSQIFYNIQQ